MTDAGDTSAFTMRISFSTSAVASAAAFTGAAKILHEKVPAMVYTSFVRHLLSKASAIPNVSFSQGFGAALGIFTSGNYLAGCR